MPAAVALLHLRQRVRKEHKAPPLRVKLPKQLHAPRKHTEHTPLHHRALVITRLKLLPAGGHEAEPTMARPLKANVSTRDLTNLKAMQTHASHDLTLNIPARTNPVQEKKELEHIATTRNPGNAKRVVRRINHSNNKDQNLKSHSPATRTPGCFVCWISNHAAVWFSTAAVSAGRYFTPINQTNPDRRMIPDTNKNATFMLV